MSSLGSRISPNSKENNFRVRRLAIFRSLIQSVLRDKGHCHVLDVGGTAEFWCTFAPDLPAEVRVTVTNLFSNVPKQDGQLSFERVDACEMPYGDNSFDLVHSNSVIEHVGLWWSQRRMAAEIRRVAPRYFVQTPNFWFPIEPHCRTAFFHWMPDPVRASMLMRKKRGFWDKAENIDAATSAYQSAILLEARQMAFLFPDAEIHREKFLGMTKSLIAIRG